MSHELFFHFYTSNQKRIIAFPKQKKNHVSAYDARWLLDMLMTYIGGRVVNVDLLG